MKEIPLTKGLVAIVDDEDYDFINQFKWCADDRGGYCRAMRGIHCGKKYTTQRMHRLLLNPPKGMEVDHINHNGLDNRRCNLRICTHAQNQHNQQKQRRRKLSQFKGVSLAGTDVKWRAFIHLDSRFLSLGYFHSEIDAAKAYDEAAKKYHGEFANLNFSGSRIGGW